MILATAALIFAAAVAASRVVLGVHYPSDVLGGLLLGLAWAAVAAPVLAASTDEDQADHSDQSDGGASGGSGHGEPSK